jgi:hypothetical protein
MGLRLHQPNLLRSPAVFEVIKGLVTIIASLVLLNMTHQNVRHFISLLINFFHLDSDAHYFKMLFDFTDLHNNEDLHTIMLMTYG